MYANGLDVPDSSWCAASQMAAPIQASNSGPAHADVASWTGWLETGHLCTWRGSLSVPVLYMLMADAGIPPPDLRLNGETVRRKRGAMTRSWPEYSCGWAAGDGTTTLTSSRPATSRRLDLVGTRPHDHVDDDDEAVPTQRVYIYIYNSHPKR